MLLSRRLVLKDEDMQIAGGVVCFTQRNVAQGSRLVFFDVGDEIADGLVNFFLRFGINLEAGCMKNRYGGPPEMTEDDV